VANRYANGGQDWWAANDPGLTPGGLHTMGAMPGATPGSPVGPNTAPPEPVPNPGGPPLTYPGNPGQPAAQPGQWQDPGPQGTNYQQWFESLFANRPFNQQTLLGLQPLLEHYGFKLTPPNAAGEQTKIQLPTGEWVRVGFGEGHPVWIPQTDAQGRSLFGGAGGAGGAAGGAGAYTGPGAIPPPFAAPTWAEVQQTPGFQARYQMGLQGLERSAAAQGSLLSGGTQKAITRYGQEYGTNEYANAYNRARDTYNTNYLTQSADPWQRYKDLYLGGLGAAQSTKTTPPIGG
jgi:hypothetical protein